MTRLAFLLAGALVLAQSILAFAQELTLHEALATARQVNPKLQSLDHLIKAKQGAAQQANVALNPVIGLSGGNRVQTLRIGQEIEAAGKRAARTNAALAEVEVAKSEYDVAALELQQEVAKLFYEILWAQKNVDLLRENLQITEKFLNVANYKLNQGFGNKLDVVKGQVEVARAKRLLQSAEKELLVSQSRLKILLKTNFTGSLTLRGDLAQSSLQFPIRLDSLLAMTERQNPALLAERHKLEAAAHQATISRLSSKPNFDFELAGGLEKDEPVAEFSMSIPLALGDKKTGAKAEAQFQQKSLELNAEEARNTVTQQVTAAFLDYQTATETTKLFEETLLREAKDAAETAQKAFEAGGFRFLDLIDAQRTSLDASLEYYESLRALRQAEIDLQAAVGIPML